MTKEDFLKWLNGFKYTGHYRRLVMERKFSEAELDFLQRHLQLKPKKSRRKMHA